MTDPHDGSTFTEAGALAGSTPAFGLGLEKAHIKNLMTLAPLSYGLQLEATFKSILRAAGIRQAEGDFTAQALLLDAQRINPHRLAACSKHFDASKATAALRRSS